MSKQIDIKLVGLNSDPDFALVQAIAKGEGAALEQLYLLHGPPILNYLIGQLQNRQLAEEVLQDVMLAVWRGANSFRGDCKVRTWLLAISRNRAISARQKLNTQFYNALTLDKVQEIPANSTIEEALERENDQAELRQALQLLPVEQRETLELVFYHELPAEEVALVLRIAPGTIKSRLHRAKATLRTLLQIDKQEDNF